MGGVVGICGAWLSVQRSRRGPRDVWLWSAPCACRAGGDALFRLVGRPCYEGRSSGCPGVCVNFEFVCWDCGADCVVWGEPKGFWRELYRLPEDWDCWNCGAINATPDPPWTPAE